MINARVGTKTNSYREPHIDAHFLFSRNRMRREMATLFNDSIKVLSIDDMSKVKVGAPAVSRYHQLKKIFPTADQPNFSDHDFPVPGYLINVSGYMFLEQKPPQENHDNNNDLMRASVYDYQSTENIPSYYRELMKVENNSMPYIDSICDQLKTHLNIVASGKDCIDLVCNEIERNETFYNSTDQCKATEVMQSLKNNDDDLVGINTVLVATASAFQCKLVIFTKVDDAYLSNIIGGRTKNHQQPPIYLESNKQNQPIFFLTFSK